MTLTATDIWTIAGLIFAGVGVLATILFWMNSTINRRFDDARRANEQAHASIGENIKAVERRIDSVERRIDSLERQIDNGLNRVQSQLSAIMPRAAAEGSPPDTA